MGSFEGPKYIPYTYMDPLGILRAGILGVHDASVFFTANLEKQAIPKP